MWADIARQLREHHMRNPEEYADAINRHFRHMKEEDMISKEYMRHFGLCGLKLLFPNSNEEELNKMQDEYERRRDA
jgi:predicted ATP-dependent Lon-type protease